MAQQQKVGTVHTTISTDEYGCIVCRYHTTAVARYNPVDGILILDTGGWYTATTKTRMNQFCNQYGLGVSVSQQRGEWSARKGDLVQEFKNGIAIIDTKF